MRSFLLTSMTCVCIMLLPVSTASATIFFFDDFESVTPGDPPDASKWQVQSEMEVLQDPNDPDNQYVTHAVGCDPPGCAEPHLRHFKDGGLFQTGTNYPGVGGIIHGYAAMRIHTQTVNTRSYALGHVLFFRNEGPNYGARFNTANSQFHMFNAYSHTRSVLRSRGRKSDELVFVNQEQDIIMSQTPGADPAIPAVEEWIAVRTTFDTNANTMDAYWSKGGNQVTDWQLFISNPIVSGVPVHGIGNIVIYNQNFAYLNGQTHDEGPGLFDYDNIMVADELFPPNRILGLIDCGLEGFLEADANKDCYVNNEDFAILHRDYLECTNPQDPNCSQAP